MPPLFFYAIVFLAVLTAVTFVLACRDDSGPRAQAAPAGPREPQPLRPEPAGRPRAPGVPSGTASAEPGIRRVDAPVFPAAAGASGAAVTDGLGLRVAELTRQVAALQAAQEASQEEIRRLRQALAAAPPPAPVRSLKTVWPVEGEARVHRIGA